MVSLLSKSWASPLASVVWEIPERDEGKLSLVYDGHRAVDQYRMYHDQGGILNQARDADVLFLGNSRVLCAFDHELLSRFTKGNGASFYNLGFGYDEGGQFPLELIERFDLRPKVVVVNCDGSFWGELSSAAISAMNGARWKTWTDVFELEAAWRLRRSIHRVVPKIVNSDRIAIWRRHVDGSWIVLSDESQEAPVSYIRSTVGPSEFSAAIEAAASYRDRLDALGIQMLFTLVPSKTSNLDFAEAMAEELEIPLLVPSSDLQLTTFDGDHLDSQSSKKFTKVFLKLFSNM